MKKWILRSIVIVLVLIVAGVLIAWSMVDGIAKKGVEQGGTYALGVPTKVDSVNLSLLKGSLAMNALNIANPQGFSSPHLLKSGQFDLGVQTASLWGETVVVERFILDGLDVNIELKGGCDNNISPVLNHLKQLGAGDGQPPQAQPAQLPTEASKGEGDKKIRVDKITIKNVVAHVYLPAGAPLEIKLPTIELVEVSNDKGVPVVRLVAKILPAVVAAVMQRGGDIIPKDLAAFVNKDLSAATAALGGNANRLMTQGQQEANKLIGGTGGKLIGDVQKTVGDPTKTIGDPTKTGGAPAKTVDDAFKGLIPGSKPSK